MEGDLNREDYEVLQGEPNMPNYLVRFRNGRETQNLNKCTRFACFGFKIFSCLVGLWGHQAWNYIPRVVFSLLCLYQAVFAIFAKDFTQCPNDEAKQIFYGVASTAAIISYFVFIASFIVAKGKHSALVSPSQSMEDVRTNELFLLLIVFFMAIVSGLTILHFMLMDSFFVTTGVVSIGLANFASVSTCHIFAISSLALGTLTEDTIRRIKNIQNGTLDGIIKIHEDLCTVVSNTASAYSVWFVLHWFTYGASVLFGAICIYTQLEGTKKTREKCVGDHAVLIVILTYLFLLPCVYAARITSRCADLCEKINCTTSADWNEDHPFRDRGNIFLFISYAKDARCGFKIGRITFDTSLAWLSVFFGLIALMFHFFSIAN